MGSQRRETADMAAAGYKYVNIDEGWWHGTRDASGNITVDTGGNAEGLDQQSTYQAISSANAAATAVTGSAYHSIGGDGRR